MEYCISIVFTMILSVCGLNISNYMFRIPAFENLVALPTSVISTINLSSPLQCASHCTRNVECRSTMFNTDKRCCQLLSVYMDTLSDTRPHISHGWLYYEEKIDCSNWHHFGDHWYLLDSTYRTFTESQIFCASLSPSSHVIEVHSQPENDWILKLTSTYCEVPHEYWLNGYDTDNSGTFTWIDSLNQTAYTNWYTGEPNDSSGPGSEKCIVSSTGYEGVWVDIPCTETRPVVCERKV